VIIASVNGTHGQGFLETVEREDGSALRIGMLKASGQDALRLQRLVDDREPLTYSGPVLTNGRWCVDTVPIEATSMVMESGTPPIVSLTVCESETAA
jgi:hypothetical protein